MYARVPVGSPGGSHPRSSGCLRDAPAAHRGAPGIVDTMGSRWRSATARVPVRIRSHVRATRSGGRLGDRTLTLCVAHRGGSLLAPENTLAAFAAGIAAGADWVECDVHMTRDGALVAIHDEDLRRTTDLSGPVGRLMLTDLRLADAAARFPDSRFSPQRVPTLEELIDSLPDHIGLQVEIKVPDTGAYQGIERRVADWLSGLATRSAVISFDEATLARLRKAAPAIAAGFLVSAQHVPSGAGSVAERIASRAHACGASFAGLDLRLVSRDLVAGLRERGLGVAVWTANEIADMRLCRDLKVDAVASDRPDLLRVVLDGRG